MSLHGCTLNDLRDQADRNKDKSYIFYLASPYSHPNKFVRQYRFEFVTQAAAALYNSDVIVFCPIAHSHPIQLLNNNMMSWEVWASFDIPFLNACGQVVVLMMQGWEDSVGVQAELEHASKHDMPIFYLNPLTLGLTDELLPDTLQWKPGRAA